VSEETLSSQSASGQSGPGSPSKQNMAASDQSAAEAASELSSRSVSVQPAPGTISDHATCSTVDNNLGNRAIDTSSSNDEATQSRSRKSSIGSSSGDVPDSASVPVHLALNPNQPASGQDLAQTAPQSGLVGGGSESNDTGIATPEPGIPDSDKELYRTSSAQPTPASNPGSAQPVLLIPTHSASAQPEPELELVPGITDID